MFNKLKEKIEIKRNSKKVFWKLLVFLKDIAWYLNKILFGLYNIVVFGLYSIFDYYILEPPIITYRNHKRLINSKDFPEHNKYIFNPGSLNLGKDIILLARTPSNKEVFFEQFREREYYTDPCVPLLIRRDIRNLKSKITKIQYNKNNKEFAEDFRLFKFDSKIYSNFTIAKWKPNIFFVDNFPKFFEKKIVIGELDLSKNELKDIRDVETDFEVKKIEKNWVFFEKNNDLYCIYSFAPYYRVLKLCDIKHWKFQTIISKENNLPFKKFNKKEIRLSANPIEYDENTYILLVHFRDDKTNDYCYRFWGVLIDKKSLIPTKITKRPLFKSRGALRKSPNQIIYVSSIAKNNDDFICFFGKEDKNTFYSNIKRKTLESSWISI